MKIYAHRGSSGTHPENTIAAFKAAAKLPVHGVEFDVHMTKDHELVVIHDETINRTSNGSGFIKDLTLAELKKFDFGSWYSPKFKQETIPTLREVLYVFKDTHHHLNIELKSDVFPYEGMEQAVLQMLNDYRLEARVVISSFNHEMVRNFKQLAPSIETAVLFMEVMIEPHIYAEKVGADALHAFFPTVLRPMGVEAIASGKNVRVFTVNEEKYTDLLKQVGVDAIFTDYPERMWKYLQS
ncbi:glycerophosphodiester phosphodiesterase [Psychrobacillus psychrodurans]|jgi:glycerophosphoryl diester phosphodiesterase|uniref:glycerophosphodiester phosphodiesterase n=1 Tax=Psychrobacillus TaxID=1221880 RepID=UPI0008E74E69|nr:glycerophosphodiester phosphodiesterase [Psychrobacillus psychrodurans]MCK1999436.1 glycerophosphodiester phosphodiesterase [Psychrobacillus psychrodurans]MCZ8538869.1 glycerophosphodiester phosphodiesterase [Psychrobacillus psychrodurans]SFM23804.1 glycerophosphoryl diester phosphodiesterase [Psychrobacillus psychrodurans]